MPGRRAAAGAAPHPPDRGREAAFTAQADRALAEPGTTIVKAAGELGMSRASIYRKSTRCDIRLPGRG